MVELTGLLTSFTGFVLVMFWVLRADTADKRNGKFGFFAIWSAEVDPSEQTDVDEATPSDLEGRRQGDDLKLAVRTKARKRFLPPD